MTSFKQLSILIPAHNEMYHLPPTIASIREHMPEGVEYEILVGDHDSTDMTVTNAERCGATVITIPHYVTTAAGVRNYLATAARHDWMLFLDADCELTEVWGITVGNTELEEDTAYSAAPITPRDERKTGLYENWFQYLQDPIDMQKSYARSCNLLVHRRLFNNAGRFAGNLATGEDVDLDKKLRNAGKVMILPSLTVYHRGFPLTDGQFWRRELWHGTGDFLSWRTFIESKPATLGVMLNLMLLAAGVAMGLMQWGTVLWMLLSAATIVTGAALIRQPYRMGLIRRMNNVWLTGLYLNARGLSFLWPERPQR